VAGSPPLSVQKAGSILEEACEEGPALEQVVHGLGQIVTARAPGAMLAHIGFQIGDERRVPERLIVTLQESMPHRETHALTANFDIGLATG
jgi:hypothetical protein